MGLYPEVDEYSAQIQPASYDSLEPRFCESPLHQAVV